jgi:2-dehydro-3-deoxy-D-arabinonate dehydratase
MKIYKTAEGVVLTHESEIYLIEELDWDYLINRDGLYEFLEGLIGSSHTKPLDLVPTDSLPPIQSQEIWAAGVTYLRSREARMEEAKDSGAADFYAKVYEAERPEIFFKSTATRCVGDGGQVRIRRDAKWNVPEPELTLFANSQGNIVAYTIGNDMSSRDIEGENPLYLPQAKCYDHSAAIGPCLYVPKIAIDANTSISMQISRDGQAIFSGQININQMKRTHTELIGYLFREMSFPHGVFLMTGTCLVPPNEFTLAEKDIVTIQIEGIGTLTNTVSLKPI